MTRRPQQSGGCPACASLDLPLFAAAFHAAGHPDLARRPELERSAVAELAEVAT